MSDEHALVKDEFIGKTVTIRDCTDPSWVDVSGVILDETKHTFLIKTGKKQKRIAKETATFEFDQGGKPVHINGIRITYRSEDRIKKAR